MSELLERIRELRKLLQQQPFRGSSAEPADVAVKIYFKRDCGFCQKAFEWLRDNGASVTSVDVTDDNNFTQLKPQIYVLKKDTEEVHIGGWDQLKNFKDAKELRAYAENQRKR